MNDYERIARVIRYLDESHADQPNLTTLAQLLKMGVRRLLESEMKGFHF
jgi:hypothetical protein